MCSRLCSHGTLPLLCSSPGAGPVTLVVAGAAATAPVVDGAAATPKPDPALEAEELEEPETGQHWQLVCAAPPAPELAAVVAAVHRP